MVARLWWKDARQFWPIWALVAVAAWRCSGLRCTMSATSARQGGMAVMALGWTCLYGFAVAAAAFAGERETRTLALLDALAGGTLAALAGQVVVRPGLHRWLWVSSLPGRVTGHRSVADRHAWARLCSGRDWCCSLPGLGAPLVSGHQQCASGRGAGDRFGTPHDPCSCLAFSLSSQLNNPLRGSPGNCGAGCDRIMASVRRHGTPGRYIAPNPASVADRSARILNRRVNPLEAPRVCYWAACPEEPLLANLA